MLSNLHAAAAFLTQTGSIAAALASLVVFVLFIVHRWRMRILENRMRQDFAERIAERDRLWTQRQDSLLQGVQGLLLLFHGIAVQIPKEIPVATQIDGALDRAERFMTEIRDTLPGLDHDG